MATALARWSALALLSLAICFVQGSPSLAGIRVGTGIFDITGPAAEEGMMGYAMIDQKTTGLHFRLRARAFIFADSETGKRVVFVSADLGMVHNEIRAAVVKGLQEKFGPELYTYDNVMLSATHTHGGPGGYAHHPLYDITTLGFSKENFACITNGIMSAIVRAHVNLSSKPGKLMLNKEELHESNANRSPSSYLANPEAERAKFASNTDKEMVLLRIVDDADRDVGMINWFPVHGTSMTNKNKLITGDNKGYASYLFEKAMNPKGTLPGKGSFVAAFAQSNEGDVSPNTRGAKCPDGSSCDELHSTCGGRVQQCIASGPGSNEFESTRLIGYYQFKHAMDLYRSAATPVVGSVDYRHKFVDMERVRVEAQFTNTGAVETTCLAALGDSFAAGTTDGPGEFNFRQGTNDTSVNPFWNFIAHFLGRPSSDQKRCQSPKPILFATGMINFPAPWTASVLPLQIFRVGQLYIVGVPGEFTTMSGRRLRSTILQALLNNGAPSDAVIVVAGLANAYSHYITTYEEYQHQRYEAASTLYGPHTLAAYQQEYTKLAVALQTGASVEKGPTPGDYSSKTFNFQTGVVLDSPPLFKKFGDVHQDAKQRYTRGETVSVVFYGAHPKNDFQIEGTYLTVERLNPGNGQWSVVATDGDWETTYRWKRHLVASSYITITWQIPADAATGTYRIRHFGHSKNLLQRVSAYSGSSSPFLVQ